MVKFKLKRDAWTIYASRNSLSPVMETRHLLEVEFSIKTLSSQVLLETIWRFSIYLFVNSVIKVLYQEN